MLKLRFGGNNNISNRDGKIILNKACLPLTKVLKIPANNARVLEIFKNKEVLLPLESEELDKCATTTTWVTEFCKLLENRADICEALNLLLNLDNDPDLKNYQAIIQKTFEELQLRKHLEVISIADADQTRCSSDTVVDVDQETNSLLNQHTSIEVWPNSAYSPQQASNPVVNDSQHLLSPAASRHRAAQGTCCSFFKSCKKREIKMVYALLAVVITAAVIMIPVGVLTLVNNPNPNEDSWQGMQTTVSPITEENTTTYPVNFTLKPSLISKKTEDVTHTDEFSTTTLKRNGIPPTPMGQHLPITAADFIAHPRVIIDGNPSTTSTSVQSTTTIPQKKTYNQLYFSNPFEIEKKYLDICNPNAITTVIFSIENHYDWDGIRIDCPTRIYNLKIEGSASTKNIDEILNQTSNIRALQIQCNKISVRNNGLPFISKKPDLKKLRALSLFSSNPASECSDVLSYLAGNVRHSQLHKVTLNGIVVNDKNAPEIQRTFSKRSYSAQHEIIMSNVIMQNFIDVTGRGRFTKFSKFHFNTGNVTEAARKTVDNFLTNANFSKDFSSNVHFSDAEMKKVLKDFRRLQTENLNVGILVRESRSHISFNFTKSMKKLNKLELGLYDWQRGNHTENYLLLTDLSSLRGSLREFKVDTNFKTKSLGSSVHCRNFERSSNAQGGITIEFNLCPDCNDISGCMRRKKR